uniref:Protein S100 n=1 Tax=Mola mola TaxID=94237 RepID=A0A3Q3W8B3_MOLML
MSAIMQAMKLIKDTFDKYAGKEGDKDTLTKKELEYNEHLFVIFFFLSAMDKFFNNLDNDRDGVVSFEEFVTFVAPCNELVTCSE